MAIKDDYQRVAHRAIKASNDSRKIQEKSAFLSYHAFESTGCALADHAGLDVGSNVKHHQKIQNFKNAARQHCDNNDAQKIANLIVTLNNLRNKFLYAT
ncbi:MAG: hypothetical protein LC437_09170 [Thiohalomonas sp.]|nr:hypothetical protein [Thiohalomonas sp.]